MAPIFPHVGVVPGEGLVLRVGDAVLVLAAPPARDPAPVGFAPALISALQRWAQGPAPSPDEFSWMVAEQLVAHRRTVAAVGAAVRTPGGYRLLLHGSARAVARSTDGSMELVGTTAATWVDLIVGEPLSSLSLTVDGQGQIRADPGSDLRSGPVSGSGVVLTMRAPAPAGSEPGANDGSAARPGPIASTVPSEPVAGPKPVSTAPDPVATRVQIGSRRQPEMPSERDPRVADVRPPPARPVPATAETMVVRSTVAVLLADDGTRTLLDRDYVLGRDPQHDRSVANGVASPVAVRDPDNLISRVQVFVQVREGVVVVRDNRSTNGTFIAAAGAAEWHRLGAAPAPLPPGWSMRIGRRVFTHLENEDIG